MSKCVFVCMSMHVCVPACMCVCVCESFLWFSAHFKSADKRCSWHILTGVVKRPTTKKQAVWSVHRPEYLWTEQVLRQTDVEVREYSGPGPVIHLFFCQMTDSRMTHTYNPMDGWRIQTHRHAHTWLHTHKQTEMHAPTQEQMGLTAPLTIEHAHTHMQTQTHKHAHYQQTVE